MGDIFGVQEVKMWHNLLRFIGYVKSATNSSSQMKAYSLRYAANKNLLMKLYCLLEY